MKKKSGRRGCDGNEYIVVTTPGERGTYSCDGCVNCCPTRIEQIAHGVVTDLAVGGDTVEDLEAEEIQQASRCIKFVRDVVDHGLRADLTPTRMGKVLCTVMEAQAEADHWYQEYLKHSNDHMRSRAAGALSGEYGKLISEIRAVVVKGIKHRAAMGDGVDAVMPTSNEFTHNIYLRRTNDEMDNCSTACRAAGGMHHMLDCPVLTGAANSAANAQSAIDVATGENERRLKGEDA